MSFPNHTYPFPSCSIHLTAQLPSMIRSRSEKSILPNELLLLIRSILISNSSKSSAANLIQCSKSFYVIFLPVLYEKIELKAGSRGNGIFEGLIRSYSFDENYDEDEFIESFDEYLYPTSSTHLRKLQALKQCTNLTIQDLPSAISIIEAQESAVPSTSLFPNLQKLVLGSNLILPLASEFDTDGIKRIQGLSNYLKPKELCVWYASTPVDNPISSNSISFAYNHIERAFTLSIPQHTPEYSHIGYESHYEAIQCCSRLYDNSKSLRLFLSSLQPSKVTIHNVNMQNLPRIQSAKEIQVFFTNSLINLYSQDRFSRLNNMYEGFIIQRRLNNMMECILHDTFKERRYTFVNAEPVEPQEQEELNYDGNEMMDVDNTNLIIKGDSGRMEHDKSYNNLEERIRKTIRARTNMTFLGKDEVDICECCGGK